MNNYYKYFLRISILGAIYLVLNTALFLDNNLFHLFMSWNLFLAWVPLGLATLIFHIHREKKFKGGLLLIITLLLGVLWLLFYPNSTYIITDFIHISDEFQILKDLENSAGEIERVFIFNDDFSIWLEFVGIAIGALIGYTMGMMSLFLHEEALREKFGSAFSNVFIIIIHILTGYAITIGRFERWNSWDIFNPLNIIKIINNHWNIPSLKFTLLFATLSLATYLSYRFSLRAFLPKKK